MAQRTRSLRRNFAALALVVTLGLPSLAQAQAALDDDGLPTPAAAADAVDPEAPRYGVQVRGRFMFLPKGLVEIAVDEAPSGMFEPGFGVDFIRRKGNFELVVGFGYDRIRTDEGLFLEKGDQPPAESPDYVVFDGLGWITGEVLFMWHTQLHEMVHLRYGGGFGLGLIVGDALQTDTVCTGASTSTCTPITSGPGQIDDPADIFPIWPVVNFRGGVQVRPNDDITINFDLGLRTAFFFGMSAGYYF
ncbi:MAG: hypothetical protein KJO07_04520 [Deltaproteobacteria bacterium]|jgi:hypothetical protein|nr:hypothetical protein [Deltaproteobacteria bacterium]